MKRIRRSGRANPLWILLAGGAVAAALLTLLLAQLRQPEAADAEKLTLYCAAGMRVPVEEIAKRFEEETGIAVEMQYDGSNALLRRLEIDKFNTPDLYLAADDYYVRVAREKHLAAETIPIAHQDPVIVVRNDNESLGDVSTMIELLQRDVRIALANPEHAAIGRNVRNLLKRIDTQEGNLWTRLDEQVTRRGVYKGTVNEVANDVRIGSADAAVVWDSTAMMPKYREQLRSIRVPELAGEPNLVTVAVLEASRHPRTALKFARYLAARDRGLPVFEQYALRPVDGDVWALRPEITFFCGAVNKRAVEGIIERFEQREGVKVNAAFNGCGILTGQMSKIDDQRPDLGFPDAYMACDVYYLENVKEWFQEAANVSDVEIVLVVPKGSTKVRTLADLIEPGIRVAIGEPDQCTIGALTRRILQHENLYEPLMAKKQTAGEVVVDKASSALLVPDVVTGNVDVAVAYVTDANANRERVDILPIESPLNVAVQPFSIAKTSDHKYLTRRLFQQIASSPEAFESVGFHFRLRPKKNDDDGDIDSGEGDNAGP
jgi:molybdenum ABC transporter molybdate-binding protein